MSARTTTVLRALAQAGDRGLAHLATQQNTGTWISRCGRQVRGRAVRSWTGGAAGAHAAALGDGFCADCAADAVRIAGTVADGVVILLDLDPADEHAAQLAAVPLVAITCDREGREPGEALIASVRADGIVCPIIARRTDTGLRLVSGSRRLAAARAAGLATVPAVILTADEDQGLVGRLLENLHRTDLNPIAQAHAFQDALDQLGLSQGQLADRLGLSRPHVCNTLRLLALPSSLREQVAAGALTAQQGRALLRVDDADEQTALAARIVAEQLTSGETDAVVRARTGRPAVDRAPELAQLADLLGGMLAAKVRVTCAGDRARVVLDVPEKDLARLLEQLAATATAAS